MSYLTRRDTLALALAGHRYDTMSQDSGMQCTCGSDSRFQQTDGDLPWATFEEHLAQVALAALAVLTEGRPTDEEIRAELAKVDEELTSGKKMSTAYAVGLVSRGDALRWVLGMEPAFGISDV